MTTNVNKIKALTVGRCTICGGHGYIPTVTDSSLEFKECSCVSQFTRLISYSRAGIAPSLWAWSIDRLRPQYQQQNSAYLKIITDYLVNLKINITSGLGLFIQGPTGVAKSAIASVILKQALDLGYSGYFVDCDKLLRTAYEGIGSSEADQLLTTYSTSDILVIDEVDKPYFPKDRDSYGESRVREVFRDLEYNMVAVIVTSNRSKKSLREQSTYDNSVLDRLNRLTDILLEGPSFRQEQ